MKTIRKKHGTELTLIFFLLCTFQLLGQDLLITNTQYLDIHKGVLKKADIAITDGKISAIKSNINPSENTQLIDGSDQYLIPGLVDAHIHLFQSGGLYTRPDVIDLRDIRSHEEELAWLQNNMDDILRRYLRCGITSVVDVGGPFANFDIRDRIAESKIHPNLFLTGPLISTYQPEEFKIDDAPIIKVHSTEEARELVRKQVPYNPDFIKIWYITLPNQGAESTYDIVEATIDESHQHNLKVAVHATQLNTAKLALRAGADFLVHSVDDPVDEDFIALLKKNNAAYIPTLMVHRKYIETFSQKYNATPEDFKYANPEALGTIFDTRHLSTNESVKQYKEFSPQLWDKLTLQEGARATNVKRLQEAGIRIATGTDAGNIGTQHASSYYEELKDMLKAGLPVIDILRASTIQAMSAIGKEDQRGSIDVGKYADLVLLNENPINSLAALQEINFVIKDGHIIRPDTLIRSTPASLAQQQLNAYNARDIDAFLAPYSEDVEIYNYPDQLVSKGKENMRPGYENMFNNLPDLHCKLLNRIVQGKTVIDYEEVTGFSRNSVVHAIAIYKIENGKIKEVRFIQ